MRSINRHKDRPIFLQNLCDFWMLSNDVHDKARLICDWPARLGNKWIDETRILSSKENIQAARVLLRILNRIADFSIIQPPYGSLSEVVKLYKRLDNMVGC